jgi:hypothetical protein
MMWLALRLTGAVLGTSGAAWLVAGYAYGIALDYRLVKALSASWHAWVLKGPFFGALGILIGPALYVVGRDLATERRWRRGTRRGSVILRNLRSGKLHHAGATQELTCTLEADVAGMAPIRADYRANVGPLDARWLVEGVALACEANPVLLPQRVRVWLVADPLDRELTGRHVDFHVV